MLTQVTQRGGSRLFPYRHLYNMFYTKDGHTVASGAFCILFNGHLGAIAVVEEHFWSYGSLWGKTVLP